MYGIIQWFIISLILIILVHHLFSFFKDTLTVPKVKDLVNQPAESYREIEKTLNAATRKNTVETNGNTNTKTETPIDQTEMKNELKSFFDNLRQNKGDEKAETPTFSQLNSSNMNTNMNASASMNTSQYSEW